MTRRTTAAALCFLLAPALLALSGCTPPAPAAPPEAPKVTVAHPTERELMDYDQFTGWLDADQTVEVRSRVRGHIVKVHFTDGDIVEPEAPLFDLDPRPYQAEVDRAKEEVKIYEAQHEVATNDLERLQ
jgi:multidrug efflux pump subunit AcrA (membrane-fusion protein)